MVYAQHRILPGEWDGQNSLGFWDTNRSFNLGQKTRSCCIDMNNYRYTCTCRNIFNTIRTSEEKYTSHFIERVVSEKELETEQKCNILTPTLMAITAFLSRSPGLFNRGPSLCWDMVFIPTSSLQLQLLNRGSWGPPLLGAGSLYSILSPTDLNFLCTELYYCFTPTQSLHITGQRNMQLPPSLEWHVWSSSSGNNCHAVHRSPSSGASVCDCTVGF